MDKFIREQLNNLNIQELELVLEDIVRGGGGEMEYPKLNIKDSIISIIKGKKVLDFKHIISGIANFFLRN